MTRGDGRTLAVMNRWRRYAEPAWRPPRIFSVRAGSDDVLPVMSVAFVLSGLLAEAGHAEADGAVLAGCRDGLVNARARARAGRRCRL